MFNLTKFFIKGTICLFTIYGLLKYGEESLEKDRSDNDLDIDLDNGKEREQ